MKRKREENVNKLEDFPFKRYQDNNIKALSLLVFNGLKTEIINGKVIGYTKALELTSKYTTFSQRTIKQWSSDYNKNNGLITFTLKKRKYIPKNLEASNIPIIQKKLFREKGKPRLKAQDVVNFCKNSFNPYLLIV